MDTNRRDLLLAGACATSTALFWSVATPLRAKGPIRRQKPRRFASRSAADWRFLNEVRRELGG